MENEKKLVASIFLWILLLVTQTQQQQYLFASKGGLPEEHQLNSTGHPWW